MSYDVVVMGGGAAGLSGALALSRARRSVLVVDGGAPRNAPADSVHNYLGREGTTPAELLAGGREEVARYGGEVVRGTVAAVERAGDPAGAPLFRVELSDGRAVEARRMLVAVGLVDELPDIPGVAERWGRDVIHCPYCHGWEVRDQAIGVLGVSPLSAYQAVMFRQWSQDVTLFLHTASEPSDELWDQLVALGIEAVAGEVAALEVEGDRLVGVRMRSGHVFARQAVVVAPRFAAPVEALRPLGLEATDQEVNGQVVGRTLPTECHRCHVGAGRLGGRQRDRLARRRDQCRWGGARHRGRPERRSDRRGHSRGGGCLARRRLPPCAPVRHFATTGPW